MKPALDVSPEPHNVASSREDAWIETDRQTMIGRYPESRPPARTRGLIQCQSIGVLMSLRRVLPRGRVDFNSEMVLLLVVLGVASSREDAWIETQNQNYINTYKSRVLPRGRVD